MVSKDVPLGLYLATFFLAIGSYCNLCWFFKELSMCKRVKTGKIIDLSKELKPEELKLFYKKASHMNHSLSEHALWVLFQKNPELIPEKRSEKSE
ncbi:MAG: hypothetical protein AAGH40_09645 [Verrucomicrobiota bacterium]